MILGVSFGKENMRIIKTLLFLILCSSTVYSQVNKQIDLIKKDYYSLKELQPNLKKKATIELGYSTEGAGIIYYVNDNNEVLIVESEYLGETGKAKHEYYFKNGSLFFLFTKEEFYNAPISTLLLSKEELEESDFEKLDYGKSDFSENRYYFHNDRLIKWLDNNRNSVSSTTKEFIEAAKHYLKFSKEIKSKYDSEK